MPLLPKKALDRPTALQCACGPRRSGLSFVRKEATPPLGALLDSLEAGLIKVPDAALRSLS